MTAMIALRIGFALLLLAHACSAAVSYTFTVTGIVPLGTLNYNQFSLGVAKYAVQSSSAAACDVRYTSASTSTESDGVNPFTIVFSIGANAQTGCLSTMIKMVNDGQASRNAFINVETSLNPAPVLSVSSVEVTMTGSTNAPPSPSSDDSTMYIAIGGGVAGGLLVIIVVACLLLRRTETRRKALEQEGGQQDNLQPLVAGEPKPKPQAQPAQQQQQQQQPPQQHAPRAHSASVSAAKQDPAASPAKSPSDSPHRHQVAEAHHPPAQPASATTAAAEPTPAVQSNGRIDSAPPFTNDTQAPLPGEAVAVPIAEEEATTAAAVAQAEEVKLEESAQPPHSGAPADESAENNKDEGTVAVTVEGGHDGGETVTLNDE